MKRLFLIGMVLGLSFMTAKTYALPPWGPNYKYSAYVHVYDEYGTPKPDIWVTFSLWAQDAVTLETLARTASGKTDANGYVVLNCYISWDYDPVLIDMIACVSSSDYATIRCSGNYTTTGNTLYPQFWVKKDLDQNGIADDYELPLAEKFCPTLKLHHPTEWIAPEPVEIMTHTLYWNMWYLLSLYPYGDFLLGSTENWNYSHYDNPFYYFIETTGFIVLSHFEWAGLGGNDPSSWISAYQVERNTNHYRHTIYAHFFISGSRVITQYWFFYPYNDGYNNHEGDWEHINVHLNSQNPSTASIQKIDFYFHHKVKSLTSGYQLQNGTHPVVYVGGSCAGIDWPEHCLPGNATGGSYPWSGKWYNVGDWGYDEYVHTAGPTISYTSFIDGNPKRWPWNCYLT